MEDEYLTPKELKYKTLIREMKERREKHDENHPFQNRGGGFVFSDPKRIAFFVIMLVIINLFFAWIIMSVPKTTMNICLIGGIMVIFSLLILIKIIHDARNWLFIRKYEKEVADNYLLTIENDENNQECYFVEFTVSSAICDPITKKYKITKDSFDKINHLGYVPVVLTLGMDLYDYNLDLNKLNKLTKQFN